MENFFLGICKQSEMHKDVKLDVWFMLGSLDMGKENWDN